MEIEVESDRHPFRFLFKVTLFLGLMGLAAKLLVDKKEEWSGLTESEARAKLEGKLEGKVADKIGEDQAAAIKEQVITALKDKGIIKPDPVEEAVKDIADAAEKMVDDVVDAAEEALDG